MSSTLSTASPLEGDGDNAHFDAHTVVFAPLAKNKLPYRVMEALAMERPVVASRIGGNPHIVAGGETGFPVPPGDAQALRAAIERLLAGPVL